MKSKMERVYFIIKKSLFLIEYFNKYYLTINNNDILIYI